MVKGTEKTEKLIFYVYANVYINFETNIYPTFLVNCCVLNLDQSHISVNQN